MARPASDDPLVALPVRVPRSFLDRLRVEAGGAGLSLSSYVRGKLAALPDEPVRTRAVSVHLDGSPVDVRRRRPSARRASFTSRRLLRRHRSGSYSTPSVDP